MVPCCCHWGIPGKHYSVVLARFVCTQINRTRQIKHETTSRLQRESESDLQNSCDVSREYRPLSHILSLSVTSHTWSRYIVGELFMYISGHATLSLFIHLSLTHNINRLYIVGLQLTNGKVLANVLSMVCTHTYIQPRTHTHTSYFTYVCQWCNAAV